MFVGLQFVRINKTNNKQKAFRTTVNSHSLRLVTMHHLLHVWLLLGEHHSSFLATRSNRKEVNQFHMSEQLQARIPHVFCRSSSTSKNTFFPHLGITVASRSLLTSYLSHGNK
ncbi:hypothetical protein CEXT_182331 [Caerostris extrusa]|uniref:Uncharacterized protein n=1 Tax=Caerostris extrusa TaxID=172846 RepID=A0AAV4N1F0_CAEEX|nr:hypothetical protein CEXT_182331 [Caerostris extrusa]